SLLQVNKREERREDLGLVFSALFLCVFAALRLCVRLFGHGTPLWPALPPHIAQPSSLSSPVSSANRLPLLVETYTRPFTTAGWNATGSPTDTDQSSSPVFADRQRTSPDAVPTNTLSLTRAGGVSAASSNSPLSPSLRRLFFQTTFSVLGSMQVTSSPMALNI